MRLLSIGFLTLFASCATHSSSSSAASLLGCYRMQTGPDSWSEVELLPEAAARCSSVTAVASGIRFDYTASWRLAGDDYVWLDVRDEEHGSWFGPRKLAVRATDGRYVYLVPPSDLEWFDQHGPMHEFCFYREGAPLELWQSDQPSNQSNG